MGFLTGRFLSVHDSAYCILYNECYNGLILEYASSLTIQNYHQKGVVMITDMTLSDRVHQIYEDCGGRHTVDGLHDGSIPKIPFLFNPYALEGHRPDIRDILVELASETHRGCSWETYMFDIDGNQWADSETVTELLLLGVAAGFLHTLTPGAVQSRHLKVSIFNQPWYRTTGL